MFRNGNVNVQASGFYHVMYRYIQIRFIPLSDLKTALATVSADFCSTIFCPFDSFVVMSNFDSVLDVLDDGQDKFSVAEILDDCGRCCDGSRCSLRQSHTQLFK